ncbi:hypothetical protein JTB14_029177 [Gonioctena quinquepunctata]|nr:hypothetical protein JTB14_029177 [Gonioctena quinquepunctata]
MLQQKNGISGEKKGMKMRTEKMRRPLVNRIRITITCTLVTMKLKTEEIGLPQHILQNSAPCQTAPSCFSQTYSTSTKNKMGINKTSRLQESLKTNARFIDINEKKFSDDKIYQGKKISLMETKLENREIFEDRVASASESVVESLRYLASGISIT